MDSINKQQQEDTQKPLQGKEAVEKIRGLAEAAKTCFFCTGLRNGSAFGTRPMSVQKIDDQGSLWFLSANDSHKDQDIKADPSVQLFFQGSAHSEFLTIYGEAIVSQDKAKIDELWEPLMKTWFTGGKDDPRISVIEVRPSESYYWDNKHGNAVAFIKMLTGAIIGKTLDDSVEGKLKV